MPFKIKSFQFCCKAGYEMLEFFRVKQGQLECMDSLMRNILLMG